MKEASIELMAEKPAVKTRLKENFYYFIKRCFDIVMALLSLVLLSPLFLVLVILIRVDSKGKAIFKQKRIGKNGQPIYIYKFRSMIVNAEDELERLMQENPEIKNEYLTHKKLKNDPRLTNIGKKIRKASMDELPQLLNILKGDMSFVGPRPYLYREKDDMQPYYSTIIKMKPGLTGMWQVSGRNNISFSDRCNIDYKYYHIKGLKTDIKLLFKTFKVVFKCIGAK